MQKLLKMFKMINMKTNKKFIILPALFLTSFAPLFAMSCDKMQNDNSKNIIKEEVDFVPYGQEYLVRHSRMSLYYVDQKLLPYVEISEMINTLNGFLNANSIWAFKNIFTNSKSYYNGSLKLKVNWLHNTITVKKLDFFNFTNNTNNTNYSHYLKYTGINYIDYGKDEIQFNLNDYGFDILYYKGKVLIPLAIFNALFCANNYYSLYYNGSKVIGTEFWLSDKINNIERLKDGAYTIYESAKWITEEYRKHNLNYLNFVFDYFYGLRDAKNIIKTNDFISQEMKNKILSLNVDDNNEGYAKFLFGKLDDLHTSMTMLSFFNQKNNKLSMLNPNFIKSNKNTKYNNLLTKLTMTRKVYHNIEEDSDDIRFKGNTAIITLNSFKTGTKREINSSDGWKYDSYFFMQKAMNEIKNHGEIKNIVLDLSTNGGGNVSAMRRVLGFLTNNEIHTYTRNSLSHEIYKISTKTDTNGDGLYNENDGYGEYKWYVLTSFNTFSAANEFTAVAKDMGIATIIGEKSGGGMCSIMPMVLPDGTTSVISSNNQGILYNPKTKEVAEIEDGIEPNYAYLQDDFYDDNKLTAFIDSL